VASPRGGASGLSRINVGARASGVSGISSPSTFGREVNDQFEQFDKSVFSASARTKLLQVLK
jgi:hypothetical protein